MSLSENIKRWRQERGWTQEQLATSLGISSQAVSKWETSETYPDGALLVPLSKALEVSLDQLLDNDFVSMADLSRRIITLLYESDDAQCFHLARDIGWQIQRGLFNSMIPIEEGYDPNDIKERRYSSCILNDHGFTVISNGKEPFFSVFPEPEDGFGDFWRGKEDLQRIFTALSHADTLHALMYLMQKPGNYVFEGSVLAQDCDISADRLSGVLDELMFLRTVRQRALVINGEARILYASMQNHALLALFLMAKECGYKGAYCLKAGQRQAPLVRQ